jgi:hemolysin III
MPYTRVRVPAPHSATSSLLRPRMRGVADIFATGLAVPAVALLIAAARPGAATLAAAVYGASLVLLLIGSAVYHLPRWPLRTARWLRKVDHSNIYLLIAGTCTPLAFALTPGPGEWLLAAMWLTAALGVAKTMLWPHAPRRLNATFYVLMGTITFPCAPALADAVEDFHLLALGGLLYVLGAAVYALRWPNPAPLVFGYHEVFHLFVFAAVAAHYRAIWSIVT